MEAPVIKDVLSQEEIEVIQEIKFGLKVLGKCRQQFSGSIGVTMYFLEDGSHVIEDDAGNVLTEWPEYVPPVPEEVEADE